MASPSSQIEAARQAAAAVLVDLGRLAEAGMVARGQGDDFLEVRAALLAVRRASSRVALLERALHCYADPDFWDAEPCEAMLAYHDRGDVARAALRGRDGFAQHRD
ncbi:hypothetical protein SAMN03159338_0866 [Sphingomonas sp. NFR04]|uniref:hypothetical protein n=1 Tax=Sphingomonas sp. NFR04 TaxID=1566283 RepID=UPI0008F275B5|nr:hypothetical protein [Sphingomonas sp. NFR04]SFJ12858.1 hypothetical protein SAMN03159338_0866 [Sphingomonas sp. NFR04]